MLLRSAFLILLAAPAWGQTLVREVATPATDTLQPANPKYHLPVSELGPTRGVPLYVFITGISEQGNGVEFTFRHPMILPKPRPVFIRSEQLQWVRMNGNYYEPVRLAGEKPRGLAQRLSTGPRAELFDVATGKKGVPIPLPVGGVMWTGAFSSKLNHAYYLRRPGTNEMVAVPDGRKFAPFLAAYVAADAPELAAALQASPAAPGYRYADLPALLERYNAGSK